MERLHKFLARAGVDSRRACEELMLAGRVTVNGRVQRELGAQIDPDADDIRVDGEPVKAATEMHYVLLHKPRGVITSMSDPEGRPTVADLVKTNNRMFPVGRLDFDSEGLLLMTDDGDLAYKLTHPSFQVEKEYHALLNEAPSVEQLRQWREGVELEDGRTAPAWVETLDETPDGVWVRVVIHEGRNRQVRRVAETLGLEVKRLVRLREGPLVLKDLALGEWRPLTESEISSLRIHAKQSRAWLPARPLPESPQDENPQDRPRFQRIDRAGQPSQRRDEVGDPRDTQRGQRSLGGNRPLRRRGADESFSSLHDQARAMVDDQQSEVAEGGPPADHEGGPLRRRDEGRPFNRDDRPRRDDERGGFRRDDRPRRDDDRGGFNRDDRPRRDEGRPFNRDDRPRRDDDRGGFRRDDERGGFRRDDRPRRDDDRGGFNRDDRPRRDEGRPFNRDDRPRRDDERGGFRRDDERGGFRRDDRPRRDDERGGFNRDDRPRRDEGRPFNRDDRPRRDDDRGGFRRDDRPRRDDERGGFRRDDERGGFNRDDRPRRDDERGGFRRDEGRPFNRDDRPRRDDERGGFRRDDRPRRDDERGGFRRDDRPRRDDERGGFRRDEGRPFNRDDRPRRDDERGGFRRDDRLRRDDERGGFNRDEGRPFNRDDRPRRDDERGGFNRDDRPRQDESRPARPIRRREANPDQGERPWERSQEASRGPQPERQPAGEGAPRPEPRESAPPAPRPEAANVAPAQQPSAPRERPTDNEAGTGARRPWTRLGARGIVGRSRAGGAARKPKGDDDE